jgi:hypothetical protein
MSEPGGARRKRNWATWILIAGILLLGGSSYSCLGVDSLSSLYGQLLAAGMLGLFLVITGIVLLFARGNR